MTWQLPEPKTPGMDIKRKNNEGARTLVLKYLLRERSQPQQIPRKGGV
jgi:hypothetical protein